MEAVRNLIIKLTSKYIGIDQYGNQYYKSYGKDYLGKHRRLVIFKNINELSKIPCAWYSWLHYLINKIPNEDLSYSWQIERVSNMTGTDFAYSPLNQGKRLKVSADYISWNPKNIDR